MCRILALVYGVACNLLFLATALYAVGFLSNTFVPKSIDHGGECSLTEAILVDGLLLLLFALQHSGMARSTFKTWLTRFIPPALERSTYVLCSSLALGLVFWQWRAIPWAAAQDSRNPDAHALGLFLLAGVGLMVAAVFQLDGWELVGLRQTYAYAQGRPVAPPTFQTPGLYRWVRHPLMLGALIALTAMAPLSASHCFFSAALILYILIGIRLEERDLVRLFGPQYEEYRRKVPMLAPTFRRCDQAIHSATIGEEHGRPDGP